MLLSALLDTLSRWLTFFLVCFIGVGTIAVHLTKSLQRDLPGYEQIENHSPYTITRIYSSSGSVIGEFAKERRDYVKIQDVPVRVIHAFLAAEDRNFFSHEGVDLQSLLRANIISRTLRIKVRSSLNKKDLTTC